MMRTMEWNDRALVLSARKHGENALIATLLTREMGVHAGLIRGGAGKSKRGLAEPGNLVAARWRARLPEHLGTYELEPLKSNAAPLLRDAAALSALSSALAVTESALPEREPHPAVFEGLLVLLESLETADWPTLYVKWELGLLVELGFGLDFSSCAATGMTEELIFVSPKSGRAVSRNAGEPYRTALLPLPEFLLKGGWAGNQTDILDGLNLTGYFLDRHVFGQSGNQKPPAARKRLLERLRKEVPFS